MFLRESRPAGVQHLGVLRTAWGEDLWMAVWPAADEPGPVSFYAALEAMALPRARFRLVTVFGGFPRAQAGRQLLNQIRNALVPSGACVLAEPRSFDERDADETLRELATAAGFFRVRVISSEAQVTLYELRR
ncbi:MAG TPA: hypothetical protein VGG33_07850 [Polyangia bacterium]